MGTVTLALLGALSVSGGAEPPFVVADGTSSAELQFSVSDPNAQLELSANLGQVDAVSSVGPGKWRAKFTPPAGQVWPQVAIIAAVARSGGEAQVAWVV